MKINFGWQTRITGALLTVLVMGGDWLLYGVAHPGVNIAILQAALSVLLGVHFLGRRSASSVVFWVALLAALGLALALAAEPTRLGLLLSWLSLVSLAAIGRVGWVTEPLIWLHRWLTYTVLGWWWVFRDARLVRRWRERQPAAGWRRLAPWALPVVIALAFVVLFRLANPLVEYAFGEVWRDCVAFFRHWHLPGAGRLLLWLSLFCGGWALLRGRTRPLLASRPRVRPPPLPAAAAAEARLVFRTLLLCNAVFAAQNLLDSGYLWGGLRLPAGMSYAAYAHRGAYPLVVAALLAGALVLWALRPRGAVAGQRPARLLLYLWLGQTIVLTGSALWRLHFYVQAYGLTRLRVAAAIWMVLVAMGLALILWRLARDLSNVWLWRANGALLLVTLYACAWPDFDGAIARWNVAGQMAGRRLVPLDVAYLERLGPASLPALRRWRDAAPTAAEHRAAAAAVTNLERELAARLADWRGWTWRRQQVRNAMPAAGGDRDARH